MSKLLTLLYDNIDKDPQEIFAQLDDPDNDLYQLVINDCSNYAIALIESGYVSQEGLRECFYMAKSGSAIDHHLQSVLGLRK